MIYFPITDQQWLNLRPEPVALTEQIDSADAIGDPSILCRPRRTRNHVCVSIVNRLLSWMGRRHSSLVSFSSCQQSHHRPTLSLCLSVSAEPSSSLSVMHPPPIISRMTIPTNCCIFPVFFIAFPSSVLQTASLVVSLILLIPYCRYAVDQCRVTNRQRIRSTQTTAVSVNLHSSKNSNASCFMLTAYKNTLASKETYLKTSQLQDFLSLSTVLL